MRHISDTAFELVRDQQGPCDETVAVELYSGRVCHTEPCACLFRTLYPRLLNARQCSCIRFPALHGEIEDRLFDLRCRCMDRHHLSEGDTDILAAFTLHLLGSMREVPLPQTAQIERYDHRLFTDLLAGDLKPALKRSQMSVSREVSFGKDRNRFTVIQRFGNQCKGIFPSPA